MAKKKKVRDPTKETQKGDAVIINALLLGIKSLKTRKGPEKVRPTSNILYGRRCPKCQEVVVSLHVHDFRECGCGALAIDGGQEYCRLVGNVDLDKLEIVKVRLSTGYNVPYPNEESK